MTFPAAAGNFSSLPDEKVSLRAVELSASFQGLCLRTDAADIA